MVTIKNCLTAVSDQCVKAQYYLSAFFCTDIEDNGTLENWANSCLKPSRCTWTFNGRKVTKLDFTSKHYELTEETSWLPCTSNGGYEAVAIAMVWVASLVIGAVLKLAAWLFVQGVFQKNADFVNLCLEERKKKQAWAFYNQSLERQDIVFCPQELPYPVSVKLGYDMINLIGYHLLKGTHETLSTEALHENLPHLVKFSRTCKAFHASAGQVYNFHVQSHLNSTLVQTHFPSIILNSFNKPESGSSPALSSVKRLSQSPYITLPAHRTSDAANSNDFHIQAYNSVDSSGILNFIKPKDMGSHTIKWGFQPIPFIAIKTLYRQEDDRFIISSFTYLAYRVGLRKNCYLTKEGVITIYKRFQDEVCSKWHVYLPWSKKIIEIIDSEQTMPETARDRQKFQKQAEFLQRLETLLQNGWGGGLDNRLKGISKMPDGKPVIEIIHK